MNKPLHKTPCRLCLATPQEIQLNEFTDVLETVLASVDCASLLLNLKTDDAGFIEEAANELMAIVFPHDTAFLIADQPDLALKLGADGIHLSNGMKAFETSRKTLGAERIVGIGGLTTRHDAMEAGEAGADYVAFNNPGLPQVEIDTVCDFANWWTELFQVPCVAFDDGTPQTAQKLISSGVDFLCPSDKFWTSPNRPAKTAKTYIQLMQRDAAA